MIEHIQPSDLFPGAKLGFTQVVATSPGRLIWVAGQTACDPRGRPIGGKDVGAQAEAALENVGRALAAAGAGPADVTMLKVYIVGFDREAGRRSPSGSRSSSRGSSRLRPPGSECRR